MCLTFLCCWFLEPITNYDGAQVEHREEESYVSYEEVVVTEIIEEHVNSDGTVTRTTRTMTTSSG